VAVATYPGTVSPLRGLDPFGEAERDVWHGREAERDDIMKLVTGDGFRAGLLYGEPGVGKTSLVRAGLIPSLRDHGVVALACEELAQPAKSFATGLQAFGIQMNANEQAHEQYVSFISRAVGNAVAGQQFVFVIDDVDLACGDDRVVHELSELFAKVVSRSAGRARFLFVAASERMAALGALERRTGSLFPPSNRYELTRIAPKTASEILDRVLSLSAVAADPALAEIVVAGLARGGPVLGADIQLAAMAMRDLRITSTTALDALGGPGELEGAWLHDACRATGNERSALRLCAELAAGTGPRSADDVIRRVNLDAGYARHAFDVLDQRGVIVRGDPEATTWVLRHEVLAPRVRELTAPARAAARRAFDLLGSKTQHKERLSLGELRALRSEGITPVTPEEIDIVRRSKQRYLLIAGAIAAVPLLIIIYAYISMRGHVFFDLQPRAGGDRVIVRGGRPGVLAMFSFLPGTGYGRTIADTGLSRNMVVADEWHKIDNRDLDASRGGWDGELASIMKPEIAGLVEYAATGSEQTLQALAKTTAEKESELLEALRPIARGTPAEVQLVETALASPHVDVQRAALAVAVAGATRSDAYQDTLVHRLTDEKPELRRITFTAVRALGERGRALFQAALAKATKPEVRSELLVELAVATAPDEAPSAASAVAVLADANASPPLRERAKQQIRSAAAQDPAAAAAALAPVIGQEQAPIEARIFAIDVLRDVETLPKVPGLADKVRAAYASTSPAVRAAALPLYAKLDPEQVGGNELTALLEKKNLEKPMRVAAALAWGEVGVKLRDAAAIPIDKLMKDEDPDVRAAAASAAGKLGRTHQEKLVKMAKAENYSVRVGAAEGLAASVIYGGNPGYGIDGIAQLWREKGRPRRDAVKVWAKLARKKPLPVVVEYLATAAKLTDDTGLHPLAVEGLCNGALAGSSEARRALGRSTDDPSADVRRLVMQCVANGPEPAKNGAAIALKLRNDLDTEIRVSAARVLAAAAGHGKAGAGIVDAIVAMLDDGDREVRTIAIRAVGTLGGEAPKTAAVALARLFDRSSDEAEKLALVRAAQSLAGAEEVIRHAMRDRAPLVRVAAVEAALAGNVLASDTLQAALADADTQVRKAALERVAAQKDKLDPATLERALTLAAHDPNPELSQLALATFARVGKKDEVEKRLRRSLDSRIERERAQAGAAAIGLVERDAAAAVGILEPLLDDPSHDVRVAMLPALAAAYARTNTPDKLSDLLAGSETDAMKRLAAAAAFVVTARSDAGRAPAIAALKKIESDGPPMARATAKLTGGLIAGNADGIAFLQELVP
jgi:Cdc6-like AAA superfamily ATPase/HEAT repeat protein